MFFPHINKIKELVKTYHIFESFDKIAANKILAELNELLLRVAIDAEQRQNFYSQIDILGNVSGYAEAYFFTQNDIRYLVKRLIAELDQTAVMSLTHQGKRQNVLTRENVQWQQLCSNVQNGALTGQQIPFDLPEEIFFDKNETLQITIDEHTGAGFLFLHGCNLKDDYSPNIEQIKAEIWQIDDSNGKPNIPQTQLVPLIYKFTGAADTYAVDISNSEKILSVKNEKSTILTHVSASGTNCRLTLIDEGRNQEWCELVEMAGIAGLYTNQYTGYYPLPYPHLLRKGDRLKVRVLNGSDITGGTQAIDILNYLVFKGITI